MISCCCRCADAVVATVTDNDYDYVENESDVDVYTQLKPHVIYMEIYRLFFVRDGDGDGGKLFGKLHTRTHAHVHMYMKSSFIMRMYSIVVGAHFILFIMNVLLRQVQLF